MSSYISGTGLLEPDGATTDADLDVDTSVLTRCHERSADPLELGVDLVTVTDQLVETAVLRFRFPVELDHQWVRADARETGGGVRPGVVADPSAP